MKRLIRSSAIALVMMTGMAWVEPAAAQSGASAATALRQDMRKLWTDHTVWTRD
jgi:hypothetical protein